MSRGARRAMISLTAATGLLEMIEARGRDPDEVLGPLGLDRRTLGKQAPLRVAASESPDEIGQRAGDQKVLLHEPQLLATRRRIVGIEDPRQRLRGQRPGG